MFVAKVVGNVWATRKHERLKCAKMLLVRPVDPGLRKSMGEPVLALDCHVGAGPGDLVLVMDEGSSARQILKDPKAPVRTIVCGVVDEVGGRAHWKDRN